MEIHSVFMKITDIDILFDNTFRVAGIGYGAGLPALAYLIRSSIRSAIVSASV